MKIQDLEHLHTGNIVETIQGGISAISPELGVVISTEGGKLTIFEDGIELFSHIPEKPLQGLALRLEGVSGVSTRCEAIGNGEIASSTCQVSFNPIKGSQFRSPRFFFPF